MLRLAVVVSVALLTAKARAEGPADSRVHSERGRHSDPALLNNAAQSHRLAGNSERALRLYMSYLRLFDKTASIITVLGSSVGSGNVHEETSCTTDSGCVVATGCDTAANCVKKDLGLITSADAKTKLFGIVGWPLQTSNVPCKTSRSSLNDSATVTDDYFGSTRRATPSMGASEFSGTCL